jgi:hypothetical protein
MRLIMEETPDLSYAKLQRQAELTTPVSCLMATSVVPCRTALYTCKEQAITSARHRVCVGGVIGRGDAPHQLANMDVFGALPDLAKHSC